MVIDLLFLTTGCALLYFGGDWLVDGVSGLSHSLRVPSVIVALVVVGFGTSAPELVVGVNAMLAATPDIALGNVLGSNIANLLLVLALAALITPIAIDRNILRFDGTAMVIAGLTLWLAAYDGVISRLDATLLVIAMLIYMSLRWRSLTAEVSPERQDSRLYSSIFVSIAALIALPIGAHMFVAGAASLTATIGLSEALIGITVVAIGTSLPELATCCAAAMRKEVDTLLGGILGSNVFNSTIVIAGAVVVGAVPVAAVFQTFWLPAMAGASLLAVVFLRTGFRLSRLEAMVMLAVYGGVFFI